MTKTTNQDYQALHQLMEKYFDALYFCDWSALEEIFHQDARYINASTEQYVNISLNEYLEVIKKRHSPMERGDSRSERIVSVHCQTQEMALITAHMTMLDKSYLDYLTLIYSNSHWCIISKVFTHHTLN